MSVEITVRGWAEHRYPAERASVWLTASLEGTDKPDVFRQAVAVQDPITSQLGDLVELDAVATWSSDQIRVFSHRPWVGDGQRGELLHVARVTIRAEFSDFERLSGFLDYWSGTDGVEIGGIEWDVTAKNRRAYEAEVRKIALEDAVAKAQTYANAVRRGKVTAVQIADPGMLVDTGTGQQPGPRMMAMSADHGGGQPELDLTPEEIVIQVEVDARFRAE